MIYALRRAMMKELNVESKAALFDKLMNEIRRRIASYDGMNPRCARMKEWRELLKFVEWADDRPPDCWDQWK